MSNRILNFANRLKGGRKVPSSLLMRQPSIYLIWSQSPSPCSAFSKLTESLTSDGIDGKIYFRSRKVSSDVCCCCTTSPWVAQLKASI